MRICDFVKLGTEHLMGSAPPWEDFEHFLQYPQSVLVDIR